AETEEAQACLCQQRPGKREGDLHGQRCDQIKQQMARKDITVAAAESTRRINKFARFDRQCRTTYNPRENRGVDDGNGGDTRSSARSNNGNNEKRKQNCGECQKHVHQTHDSTIPPAPKPCCGQSENCANERSNSDRSKADDEGLCNACPQATHDVTSEKVSSHPVGSAWRTQPVYPILHQRVMRRETKIAEASYNQIDQHDEAANTPARMSKNGTQYLHQF